MGLNHIFDAVPAGLAPVLIGLWLLCALFGAVVVYRLAQDSRSARRIAQSGIREIDQMPGPLFERRLVALFRALGYRVTPTGQAGDSGAELLIRKHGVTTAVQVRRSSTHVGVNAVQEASAAELKYKCTAAMVVTNRYFTAQARILAREDTVELWDRDQWSRSC
jgi:restriction system protein